MCMSCVRDEWCNGFTMNFFSFRDSGLNSIQGAQVEAPFRGGSCLCLVKPVPSVELYDDP